jgi:hypothetical protein
MAAQPEGAAALVGLLNKVMRYAVGLGVTASVLQTSLYNGRDFASKMKWCFGCLDGRQQAQD